MWWVPKDEPKPRQQPLLTMTGDHGVYLMSNGSPRDIAPGQEDVPEGSKRSVVAYAEGLDPDKDKYWYETKRTLFGGDDGTEYFPVAWFQTVIRAGKRVMVIEKFVKSDDADNIYFRVKPFRRRRKAA